MLSINNKWICISILGLGVVLALLGTAIGYFLLGYGAATLNTVFTNDSKKA